MKYIVHKGYSYLDIHQRNQVYTGGAIFEGVVDPTQKWKLGAVDAQPPVVYATKDVFRGHTPILTKGKTKAELENDEMDEGEE